MSVAPEGLAMIARAAEGSVRDSLSLLDQALLQGEIDETVGAETVRDMLGLADRGLVIALFSHSVGGDLAQALGLYRELYQLGADPILIMNDLIEAIHAASLARILGPSATQLPEDQAMRLTSLGSQLGPASLSRLFSLALKLLDEVRRTPDPNMGMEMAIIRLCHAADLPGPEEVIKSLLEHTPLVTINSMQGVISNHEPSQTTNQLRTTSSAQLSIQPMALTNSHPELITGQDTSLNNASDQAFELGLDNGLEWLAGLLEAHKEIGLLSLVEHHFRPISFKQGAISFATTIGAPDDLGRKLSLFLKECTGQNWFFVLEKSGGGMTIAERRKQDDHNARSQLMKTPLVMALTEAFPGIQISVKPAIKSLNFAPTLSDEDDSPSD
jgi:DNA polymerase-3 subunit gamma/tau